MLAETIITHNLMVRVLSGTLVNMLSLDDEGFAFFSFVLCPYMEQGGASLFFVFFLDQRGEFYYATFLSSC